jgi:starch synthase
MPVVVLEAWAAGLPVIATRVGGLPDMVAHGEDGWLVPPADPAALAVALVRAWQPEADLAALGARGRDKVLRDYSPPIVLDRLARLYAQCGADVRTID